MATNIMMVKNGVLTLGPTLTADEMQCQMSTMVISATPDPKEFTGMCGKTTVPGITSYVLSLEGAQDWTAEGISMFLWDHRNDTAPVEFSLQPSADAEPIATGLAWIVPGDFGGAAGEIATFAVSLGIEGEPTITGVITAAATATRAAAATKATAKASA